MTFDENDLEAKSYLDFMCFRITALARRIARAHNKVCAEHKITAGQSFILFDLLDHEGSNITEISNRVQLDNPAVGGYIDRLIKEDLVIRVEDPNDRRLYRIYLTKKGRSLAELLLPATRGVHNHIVELLENGDYPVFCKCLAKLEQDL